MLRRVRELDGVMLFVIITVALTSISALAIQPTDDPVEPSAGAMLHASVLYAALVGWQPLVAFAIVRRYFKDQRPFDDGIRPSSFYDSMFAIVLAAFVLTTAFIVDGTADQTLRREPPQIGLEFSIATLLRLSVAFVAIVAIVWFQTIVDELAWRSLVLPRLMRTLGAWPGLIAHGVLWGLSYAPLFAAKDDGVARSLCFVVTYVLLGILLGWLRLATRSIYASAAANATLSICAGLPMFLVGASSRFSAAFEPPGWLSMLAVIFIIVGHPPWRAAVAIPWRRMPEHVN